MRWLVLVLILVGAAFTIGYSIPASTAPGVLSSSVAIDAPTLLTSQSFLPQPAIRLVLYLLAGIALLAFAIALVGFFWQGISEQWWERSVGLGAACLLILSVLHLSFAALIPIAVCVILLWGVLTHRWSSLVVQARTKASAAGQRNPLLQIPVPWLYVLVYLAGVVLQYVLPIPITNPAIQFYAPILGAVMVALGAALAFTSLGIFRSVHTTTVPFETSFKLVTWGPYKLSRNPMYVGLAFVYIGVAAIQMVVWSLVFLPLLLFYINGIVIPLEEAQLRSTFGEAYQEYFAHVHRWL